MPTYSPIFSFAKLLPSVVYNLLGMKIQADSFELVSQNLNTSTAYAGFYSDFGFLGVIPIIFIQILANYHYNKSKKINIKSLLCYMVLYQAIVLTCFTDTFYYLPFLFQFILIKGIKIKHSQL